MRFSAFHTSIVMLQCIPASVIISLGPPPPTGVTAVQDGPTSITVTWTPPSPLEGTIGYRISYATGSDVDIDGGSTNSYTLTGLTNGQTYTISIVAMAPNRPTSSPIEAQVTLGQSHTLLNMLSMTHSPIISGCSRETNCGHGQH